MPKCKTLDECTGGWKCQDFRGCQRDRADKASREPRPASCVGFVADGSALSDAKAGRWITLEEVAARRGLNGDFEETLNQMLSERYGPLLLND